MPLSEFELNQILEKYRTPEGMIDYKSFCENVDRVFYENEAAKDALDKNHSKPVRVIITIESNTRTTGGVGER